MSAGVTCAPVGSLGPMPGEPVAAAVAVRPLTPDDVAFAARLHADVLPHGFFAGLGTTFLTAYYGAFVASPHAVALLGLVDGRAAGQVIGPVRNRAHHRWVLRHHGWSLAMRLSVALLARPGLLLHFLRTRTGRYLRALVRFVRRNRGGGPSRGPAPNRGPAAVLSHLCVRAEARGRGLGSALVEAFLDAARQAGAHEALLVTLVGDDGASGFWAERGWTHRHTRADFEGRPTIVYSRLLR